jgi:N-methylhydantoinase A
VTSPAPAPRLLLGIDVGGTFTDIVALDPSTGRVVIAKTPTTPEDQSLGFVAGVGQALDAAHGAHGDIARVFHGTTVATNAILEGKGAEAALITSEGFRHVLEIGRHDIPRKANMFSWVKPQRPVPPERIYEVAGRIDVDGREHLALDEAGAVAVARRIKASGIGTVAICLIHSYVDPRHERRLAEIVAQEIPDALISLSSEVLPVFREFERTMATILNAYVMKPVSTYIGQLDARLRSSGVAAPLLLMKSNGGAMSAAAARREPIQTALSGPAAGALGAAHVALAAGFENVVSIDIGGTSADVCLIRDGAPALTMKGRIGEWPLQTPMVDLVTVGAGGGSIARVSSGGSLTVGPQSAGAVPGPACYGRGGAEPTVTDANLVLGRLPSGLLDDTFPLDLEAARRAIREAIAEPLGVSIETAAEGILDVVDNAMMGAIRLVSVERGLDPADFALLAFGGAGPLHAGRLAALLGMRTVIVPPHPGVLSAYGLLVADLRNDFSRTYLQRPPYDDLAGLAQAYRDLDRRADAWLAEEGTPEEARSLTRQVSLRYRNQGFELVTPWAGDTIDAAGLGTTIEAFHDLHERLYTFAQRDTPVEIVTLHVSALGRMPHPAQQELRRSGGTGPAQIGRQDLVAAGRRYGAPVYDRARLEAGETFEGPALFTQMDTTTVLFPNQSARVDRSGSIVITVS